MSTRHGDAHELIVRNLFLGDVERDDPAVVELLVSCSECRSMLAGLETTASRVEAADVALQAELEAAEGVEPAWAPDVGAVLEHIASEEPHGRRAPRRRLLLAAAAVFVGMLAFVPWLLSDEAGSGGAPPIYIGVDDQIELVTPVGSVEDYERFAWTCEKAGVSFYTLLIYADEGGEQGSPLPAPTELEGMQWVPGLDARRALPGRLWWRVEAYGPSGSLGDPVASSPLVSASRD